jgi:prepilin-type N-terminal cleavage/methylation domain-containing protein
MKELFSGKLGCGLEKRGQRGFSLVEVLVSMAVASIIITALMQSLLSASDSWSRQSKHVTSQREARTALRLLADDLSSAVALPSGGPLVAELPGQTTVPSRFWVENATGELGSSRVAFLRVARRVPLGQEAGRGDLRLVLYAVVLTDDGGASGLEPDARSQKLVRCEFSAAETFRRVQDHLLRSSRLFFSSDWSRLENPAEAPPELAKITVLAHDVIRFDLKALEALVNTGKARSEWPEFQMPTWVDLTLRVTNRQTARWLRTVADWQGQGERAMQIHNGTLDIYHDDPEVRTFAMRLRLPSQVW